MIDLPGGGFMYPIRPAQINASEQASLMFSGHQINASGEKVAMLMRVPKSGTIDAVGFFVELVGNSQTLRASLQTVDLTNGQPTGTNYGGSTAGTQASPAAGTYYEVSLGTSATAVKGDYVALVVEFDSTVGDVTISSYDTHTSSSNCAWFPHLLHFTSSWADVRNIPICHLLYDDATIPYNGCIPGMNDAGTISFIQTSSPDEAGMRFKMPFKCRMIGWTGHFRARGDMDTVLYDKDDNVLDTVSWDLDVAAGTALGYSTIMLKDPQILNANEIYRITWKSTETSNSIFVPFWDFEDNKYLDTWGSKEFYWTQRTDAGAWTDTNTRRLQAFILCDQVDSGGGFKPREFRHGV